MICCLLPLCGFAIWGHSYFSNLRIFLIGNLLNLLMCATAFLINRFVAASVSKQYPDEHQSIHRVALWFVAFSLINNTLLLTALTVYDKIGLFGYQMQISRVLWTAFFVSGGTLLAAGMAELSYTFAQWRANQQELEQMEHRQVWSELEVVKQQVNPHFLFNCLNSLSVLISEAPFTAEKFVDEMSKVYRYLLSVNGPDFESSLVSLDAEVRFIKSYLYLLEIRFETGIKIDLQIADLYLTGQMAPLTLQTLIDNAIRHNAVSADKPLEINIRTTPTGQLEISNNLQKRMDTRPSTQAGLTTLISRYKLLFNQAGNIQIREDDRQFTVILPLIYT
ncbi:MAG: sensor histidine kinase [Dyadobacter fermentans]